MNFFVSFQNVVTHIFHFEKPLVRNPENDGMLAAPAVRILMLHASFRDKRVFFFQSGNKLGIINFGSPAGKFSHLFGKKTILAYAIERRNVVGFTGFLVFRTAAGSSMN